jgi:hypothetical protein
MFGFVRIGRRFKPDPAEEGANCTGYTKPDGTEVVFDKPVNVWVAPLKPSKRAITGELSPVGDPAPNAIFTAAMVIAAFFVSKVKSVQSAEMGGFEAVVGAVAK